MTIVCLRIEYCKSAYRNKVADKRFFGKFSRLGMWLVVGERNGGKVCVEVRGRGEEGS
jgi:hypothetical protein